MAFSYLIKFTLTYNKTVKVKNTTFLSNLTAFGAVSKSLQNVFLLLGLSAWLNKTTITANENLLYLCRLALKF